MNDGVEEGTLFIIYAQDWHQIYFIQRELTQQYETVHQSICQTITIMDGVS